MDAVIDALETSNAALEKLVAIKEAATRWPRCCDRWHDGIGGMHCNECGQKTFAMMYQIQRILGVGKDGKPSRPSTEEVTPR